jgi:phenylacetate-CoA ligase
MTVQVELEKNVFDGSLEYVQDLKNRICEALRGDLALRPKVEILEPGTLPVSEGKAKRVVDQRTL